MANSVTWTTERRMFKAVTENTSLIAWATDETARCFYISPEWYRLTGTEFCSGEGFNWLASVHADDVMNIRRIFFQAHDNREAFGCAYRVEGADKTYHLVWSVGLPKFGEGGTFEGYFGTAFKVELGRAGSASTTDTGLNQRQLLSAREREVMKLIADGNTSETVASMLGISVRTVEAHVTKAASRLGATNRINAVAMAIKQNEI